MTALTDRAAAALKRARLADPNFDTRPLDPRRCTERRRLARAMSTTLGVDPVDVTVTDDPQRAYGGWHGFVVTVSDGDRMYQFIPQLGATRSRWRPRSASSAISATGTMP